MNKGKWFLTGMMALLLSFALVLTGCEPDPVANDAAVPVINAHPQDASYTMGGTATALSVSATVDDGGTLSYQWYSNMANSSTEGTLISGATQASYTPPTTASGTVYYHVVVTNTNNSATGAKTAAVTSNAAAITVTAPGDRDVRILSGVSVPFRYVPAGSFQRDDTTTNITVITRGYWIGETEVTQELFQAVMGTNPSSFTDDADNGETQNQRPVERINWYTAIAFCNKLSLANGKEVVYSVSGISDWANLAYSSIPTSSSSAWNAAVMDTSKDGYRLPTEMEWMWAAMGADTTSQPNTTGYSKAFAGSDGNNDINDYVWYTDNSRKTHEVSKKLANELDIHDMSGNVYEWCWDRFGTIGTGTLTDPTGATSGTGRVWRGGSWNYAAVRCTVASRTTNNPYLWSNYYGFRVMSKDAD